MEKLPFLFSDAPRYRLQRHIVFWLCWWAFSSIIYSFSASIINISYIERLPIAGIESFLYLIPHMFLSYTLMYYVIPKLLLKGKYLKSVAVVLLLFLATASLSTLVGTFLVVPLRPLLSGNYKFPIHIYEINFYLGLLAGLRGGLTVGGIAAAIKLSKYWYIKEQRNLQLQKENIASQLQLLKAQVHPHFLFNTLNNIYANTQVSSPPAAKMIMGLSQLLRYMLYECDKPLVPLSKELQMLQQYILLEKARYGNHLDVNISFPEEETNLCIAPLILLPFVENSFKHGTSKMLDQPWINLQVSVEEDQMKLKLVNGKVNEDISPSTGIGLTNVKKRLELLYKNRYELAINNEEEVFIVNMKIQLERSNLITHATLPNTLNTEQYA